jgi:hypothetical protein
MPRSTSTASERCKVEPGVPCSRSRSAIIRSRPPNRRTRPWPARQRDRRGLEYPQSCRPPVLVQGRLGFGPADRPEEEAEPAEQGSALGGVAHVLAEVAGRGSEGSARLCVVSLRPCTGQAPGGRTEQGDAPSARRGPRNRATRRTPSTRARAGAPRGFVGSTPRPGQADPPRQGRAQGFRIRCFTEPFDDKRGSSGASTPLPADL